MKLNAVILALMAAFVTLADAYHNPPRARASRLPSWQTPRLPEITNITVVQSGRVKFHGLVPKAQNTTCGKECQMKRTTKPSSMQQLEEELGFETLDMDGLLVTNTRVKVGEVPEELYVKSNAQSGRIETPAEFDRAEIKDPLAHVENLALNRRKRNIFGLDTRFSLFSRRYMTMYPFSTAVKLSTGCSGVLLSPKHVLTSAHCVHDGKRYVKGVRKLKVGKQMEMAQKQKKGGKRGKNRRRNRKGRGKNSRNQVNQEPGEDAKLRSARDLSLQRQPIAPYFKWVRARKMHLPQGWLKAAARNKKGEFPIEYDYAVIELKRPLGDEYMEVGICPDRENIPSGHRIHFTGFDIDRSNQMLYRFCPIEDESPDLMYHYCDAHEGTSGSGMYIRLFDRASGSWKRRVIAVFSGHQWVNFPGGAHKEFNTGVRITPLKYAQICYWTKGSYDECRGG